MKIYISIPISSHAMRTNIEIPISSMKRGQAVQKGGDQGRSVHVFQFKGRTV